ncbi:hypothetical protein PR002_g3544 [Phytophthora rubi]|uniref:Transmembrane protein 43 n=1 Tax=Phytophthora rubi TaxID=129364 RepID=A0A6A3NFF5_9STRA|nr:hypothetical protein PR002_g3544 [Phytophthora rubi]
MGKELAIGGLLLLASVATTCVYESALVRSVKSFEQGRSVVVSLSKPEVSAANEGELIHFSGLITTTTSTPNFNFQLNNRDTDDLQPRQSPFVLDKTFGVAVKGVKLHRHVEMLQWVETSHTSTSSTPEDEDRRFDDDRERIYMYDLRWREEVIESIEFNDPSYGNPPAEAWKFRSLVVKAKDLVVGEFSLPDELVDQIQRRDAVKLDASSRRVMANLLDQREGEGWGDNSEVANRGNELVPFQTTAGDSLHLLEDGIMTADELFDKKTQAQVRKNRFFRLFAGVLGFVGFLVLRRPLLERFGPLLAGIQQHVLASSMSAALTFSVVGAFWVLYSPLWALALWLGGWAPPLGLFLFSRAKHQLKNQ